MKMRSRILGIDPGTTTIGWTVIEGNKSSWKVLSYGIIQTGKGLPQEYKLTQIFSELIALIKRYKVNIVAVEQLFFSNNAKTAMAVAEARGVIMLSTVIAEKCKKPLYTYKPNIVKKFVAGAGNASKKVVQRAVAKAIGTDDPIEPDDAADAIAIALTCLFDEGR